MEKIAADLLLKGLAPEGFADSQLPETVKTADTIRVDQIADSVGKEIKLNPQNKRIRAYHYKNEKQEIYYFVNEDDHSFQA